MYYVEIVYSNERDTVMLIYPSGQPEDAYERLREIKHVFIQVVLVHVKYYLVITLNRLIKGRS